MTEALTRHIGTFMGVPASAAPVGSRAAVLGLPFDHGSHAVRIGARLGPAAIREQSALLRPYDPVTGQNFVDALKLVDCGDAAVTPSQVEDSFAAIEAAMTTILEAGTVPVTMGGDGMVSLPQMRALHRRHPDLAVVHIDAHTDAYPLDGYNTGTTFARAAEESLIDTEASFHIGARGPTMVPGVYEHTRGYGYTMITMAELRTRGFADVADEVTARVGARPVYLCFDMDFIDPAVAPGVCTPEWGGASAAEAFDLLALLADLNWVACDVNTVSPPHDVGGMTAFLAGTVMQRFMMQLCARDN